MRAEVAYNSTLIVSLRDPIKQRNHEIENYEKNDIVWNLTRTSAGILGRRQSNTGMIGLPLTPDKANVFRMICLHLTQSVNKEMIWTVKTIPR